MKKNLRSVLPLILLLFLSVNNVQAQRSTYSHSNSGTHYKSSSATHYKSSKETHNKSITKSPKSSSHITSGHHRSTYATGVARDSHGKIKRSSNARYEFMKQTGYTHGRKGYIIDHIVPLSKGGCDCPSNMQWQTIEDAKRKDKTERK